MEKATEIAVFLASVASDGLTRRFISAWADDISKLATQIPEVMGSEAYTLRRVLLD